MIRGFEAIEEHLHFTKKIENYVQTGWNIFLYLKGV